MVWVTTRTLTPRGENIPAARAFSPAPMQTGTLRALAVGSRAVSFGNLCARRQEPWAVAGRRSLGSSEKKPSPYRVLDLPTHASPEAIKARFRELARLHHPDINPSADGKAMASITEAFHELVQGRVEASDSRIANSLARGEFEDLLADGKHEVFEIVMCLDALLGEPAAAEKGTAVEGETSGDPPLDTHVVDDQPGAVTRTAAEKEASTVVHSTAYDSVADLKRDLQNDYGGAWGLTGRRLDREGLAIGWELCLSDGEMLCHHFLLQDYGVSTGDRVFVIIRRGD